eukprot:10060627-Alexandrium_andersonii.AAC.1
MVASGGGDWRRCEGPVAAGSRRQQWWAVVGIAWPAASRPAAAMRSANGGGGSRQRWRGRCAAAARAA